MIILGIDPGSQTTGYGVLESDGRNRKVVALGCLKARPGVSLSVRLGVIYAGLQGVLEQYQPDEVAVEATFYGKNVHSALVMGHARGVCLLAVQQAGCQLFEYSPLEVKKSVVGQGRAGKGQVGFMIRAMLGLRATPSEDAADALAVAVCHLQRRTLMQLVKKADLTPAPSRSGKGRLSP
ncbi:MAG: crossover junction endodeoxyribonuclease RuvC [Candidatus Edwardsbacteria bacterium RIFOXYD12_FULL_50_11]|uniref:Crossover junction endodeoxyribonuclease RuvC n=1 Tax=Candidatus Edwardsbacteria bacterium GWF2_54_11 TaxID=1817851 RepID=A0A1F5R783_9BACT|nr:MAG: crossover junction endodeoxyribonuclease RuvC [Candidatus Edwardsbacteria bacterium RifOxyC12_full_54_24]OGF08277.1 MAG: crossover junction endodeoxyribonuclease RuvC [Candidatus Edwardsbacteria bacterium RifOxyA12_full_54_48]OGF10327.1 MAG: crossover junction endodeoxyribonuclease RuvC [Candidatus Edwardsbacteria bacterium GWF2_54_11]OGF11574.1 MAG: crossover junction endodeoxyribonuclease RuvC [Candidatus Edwardsbacteria bacterium GWE2_54_12]OGF17360.1 MAG: crossover junction endodeox